MAGRWTMSLGSAMVIWIGFVVPANVVGYGARKVGGLATAVDFAQWLAVMLAQAATLTLIGLPPPSGCSSPVYEGFPVQRLIGVSITFSLVSR